ncbi:hypothetical protein RND81_04G151700 [Saponaria officinalis]|uniref:Uncharacterized protein n=1 Tax=Saponaria officinalis TaxID=3572 RepID=A0AAW1LJL4_SAPOF
MGVPAFYSWLTEKYPNVKEHVKQVRGSSSDTNSPNSNDLEFDHLYLDMNGIIHPCFHPHSLMLPPTTFEEVFENIYAYIDRLFSIVRPRKLLYLAIDGVAPRAKMNQQRSRRFRTAKDNEIAEIEEKKLREKYEMMGKRILPVLESQVSDSNVITPGTEFMFELSNALKSYIVRRLESDPGWKDIKVIISDATVPGEGEHKIMSFIRSLRSLSGYDPNTRHCLYGLDADLIMLALATHEIHFSILREVVNNVPDEQPLSESALLSTIQRAMAEVRVLDESNEEYKKPFSVWDKSQSMTILPQNYEFVHIWILREYLELDMQISDPSEKFVFDLERIVDDFIFMCFFMGNDFLPHMPTLEIYEKGVDLLMHVYKSEFKNLGGYLVDMQRVNDPHFSFIKLKRVEKFILSVGSYEEKIFQKRTEMREKKLKRILSEFEQSRKLDADESDEDSSDVCITDAMCPKLSTGAEKLEAQDYCTNSISDIKEMVENTKALKDELKVFLRKNSDIFKDGVVSSDKVKLGSAGWKQRYYKEKFSVEDPKEIEILRKDIVQKYTEGLCWVLLYYFSGIPSWNWYYDYYYGLFASELKGLAHVKVKFDKGSPFKPFDQLMAVLPPKSAHALPKAYQDLMVRDDSKIVEFYPKDFEVDTDGKRFLWQGTSKLPFIDQEKLLNTTCELESTIEVNEAERNAETTDRMFWRGSNSCAEVNLGYIVQHTEKKAEFRNAVNEDQFIVSCDLKLPVASLRAPRLLEGVQIPEKTVFENDISKTPLWHEYRGGRPPVTRPLVNRSKVQEQQWRAKEATDEPVMHKNAGTGWSGAGRGNGSGSYASTSYSNIPQNRRSPTIYRQPPSSAPSRGWYRPLQPVPTSSSNRSSATPSFTTNVNRSVESIRPSPIQANSWRGRAVYHNQSGSFWPSRNAPDRQQNPAWQDQRPTWRPSCPNARYGDSPLPTAGGRGRGRVRGRGLDTRSSDR